MKQTIALLMIFATACIGGKSDKSERLRIKTEQMKDWENQPECVLEARKLFDEYLQNYGRSNDKAQGLQSV